jgi:hypothetical protein
MKNELQVTNSQPPQLSIFLEASDVLIAAAASRTVCIPDLGSIKLSTVTDGKMQQLAILSKAYALMSLSDSLKQAAKLSADTVQQALNKLPIKHFAAHDGDKLDNSLISVITHAAKAYFGARIQEDLAAAAICDYIRSQYSYLSPSEVFHAFGWGVKQRDAPIAYGALTVEFIEKLLRRYADARRAFLSAYEDVAKEAINPIEKQQQAAEYITNAYKREVAQFQALQNENSIYEFWHQCPHYCFDDMKRDGLLSFTEKEKQEAWRLAAKYTAHKAYRLAGKNKDLTAALWLFCQKQNIQMEDGGEPLHTAGNFTFANAPIDTEEKFRKECEQAVKKILYFSAIAPYGVRKVGSLSDVLHQCAIEAHEQLKGSGLAGEQYVMQHRSLTLSIYTQKKQHEN